MKKQLERIIPIQIEGRDVPPTTTTKNSNIERTPNNNTWTKVEQRDKSTDRSSPSEAKNTSTASTLMAAAPIADGNVEPTNRDYTTAIPMPAVVTVANDHSEPTAAAISSTDATNHTISGKSHKDIINEIQSIQENATQLLKDINSFTNTIKDSQYLYLDEMLTRYLIQLDNVDACGQAEVRQIRRNAIHTIEHCIQKLESKLSANNSTSNNNETNSEHPFQKENDVSHVLHLDQ